jgi:hypothetical protein
MRRKNRKWVAMAVVMYLGVMWSAYRWSAGQGIPEGNLFVRIERAGIRRQNEERRRAAKEKEEIPPPPTGEARLNAAGPVYVAARYDATHVVFIVATDTETRFAGSPWGRSAAHPTRISAPTKPSAPLAGLQELWEPDSQSLHFFPEVVQKTRLGDEWNLSVSAETTIPAFIERVVIAPIGCSLAMGFLASIPAEQQAGFAASPREYFAVRRTAVEASDSPVSSQAGELPGWKPSSVAAKQIEQQLNGRMKDEVAKIDARLLANAGSPGATSLRLLVGDARPRLKEWLHADKGLLRDEGVLDYDARAFHVSPDGAPRLFVRARWTLAGAPAFLMTAWFQADAAPVLLWADSSWSEAMRNGEAPVSLGDRLDFETVLNEFDADRDGWAELLIHSYDARGSQPSQGASTSMGLYLYTDKGLVPMKVPLRRTQESAEACMDP